MNLSVSRPLFILFFSLLSFSTQLLSADLEAGKDKASSCLACHGKNGNSNIPLYPSLAGQRAIYIEYQLKAFQSGKRNNPVMQDQAANLTRDDMKDISAYFASLPAKVNPDAQKDGDSKIAMCKGCHGGAAEGRGGFPRLAGQQAEYLKIQLLNFKSRARKGGPMNSITSSLSEQELSEIAHYLSQL